MAVVNPYTWGLGRRKSAVARVRIQPGSGKFLINGREFKEFFLTSRDQQEAMAPLSTLSTEESYDVAAQVDGGGPHGQAGAVRLGLARALKEVNPTLFESLRTGGHLTRDSRMKERKKYGQRGARRGFQFSKR
jgi:small subunit ribosomal protein S9